MTETRAIYTTIAITPAIEPDPILDICQQVEGGELDAKTAARRIARIQCDDRLAYLAGFIDNESSRYDRCPYCGASDGQCSH